jgi:hypothetical protein
MDAGGTATRLGVLRLRKALLYQDLLGSLLQGQISD